MDPRVVKMVQLGRKALAEDKVGSAVQLLAAASKSLPNSPEIWYYLGVALAKQNSSSANSCVCFWRALQLFQAAAEEIRRGDNNKSSSSSNQLAAAAADNCWLTANSLLPVAWPAAAADDTLQAKFTAAAAHIIRQAVEQAATAGSSSSSDAQIIQLLCVGGLGLQALQLAAAASDLQSRYLAPEQQQQQQVDERTAPLFGMSFIASDSLTSHVAAQVFADNDLDDVIEVSTWDEWQQQQQEVAAVAALLAGAVQPNWPAAASSSVSACRRLVAASSSSSSSCVISPYKIKVWAVPVTCNDLVSLNQVDLDEMTKVTSGRFDYTAVNNTDSNLRRSHRPCQVSRFKPQLLAQPQVALEFELYELLQQQQQQVHSSLNRKTPAATAAAAVAAALSIAEAAVSTKTIEITNDGVLHCLVWWLEFDMAPDCSVSFAPVAALTAASSSSNGSDGSSSNNELVDALKPHIWQHVQYLPHQQKQLQQQQSLNSVAAAAAADPLLLPVYQGQHVSAGQQLLLQVSATLDSLDMSLYTTATTTTTTSSSSSSSVCTSVPDIGRLTVQQQQQQQQQQVTAVLPYHMSMLNDHYRTRAYDRGITAAVHQLLQQQQQEGDRPLVLDVGCGTGLLSMMAAAAAAAGSRDGPHAQISVIGCERNPVLAAAAQQMIKDNNLQGCVSVLTKLSSQLTVRPTPNSSSSSGSGRNTTTNDSSKCRDSRSCTKIDNSDKESTTEYDLDCKAALIVHEIFGTDPLSEQVLPALRDVQLRLAAAAAPPTAAAAAARFVPRALRVIAAVAHCDKIYQRLRLPPPAEAAAAAAIGNAQQQWDLSSLLLLQPRKYEMQLDELSDDVMLLTQPLAVLEFAFEKDWPLELNGQVMVQLPKLTQPLTLAEWMQQQHQHEQQQEQRQFTSSTADDELLPPVCYIPTPLAAAAAPAVMVPAAGNNTAKSIRHPQQQQQLVVISWFEADCGAGGWYSTRPGLTKFGHWQQSVEFVEAPHGDVEAAQYKLKASWAVDRVRFSLCL